MSWCAGHWESRPPCPEIPPFTGSHGSKGAAPCWPASLQPASKCHPGSGPTTTHRHPACPPTPRAHTHRMPLATISSCFARCLQRSPCCYRSSWCHFSIMTFGLPWIWDYPHGDFWPGAPGTCSPGLHTQRCTWMIPPGVIPGLRQLPTH